MAEVNDSVYYYPVTPQPQVMPQSQVTTQVGASYATQQLTYMNAIQDLQKDFSDKSIGDKYSMSRDELTQLTGSIKDQLLPVAAEHAQGSQVGQDMPDTGKRNTKISLNLASDPENLKVLTGPQRKAELETRGNLALNAYSQIKKNSSGQIKDAKISIKRNSSSDGNVFPPRYDVMIELTYASGESISEVVSGVDPESNAQLGKKVADVMQRSNSSDNDELQSEQSSDLRMPDTDPALRNRLAVESALRRAATSKGLDAHVVVTDKSYRISLSASQADRSTKGGVPSEMPEREIEVDKNAVTQENAGEVLDAGVQASNMTIERSGGQLKSLRVNIGKGENGAFRFDITGMTKNGEKMSFSFEIKDLSDLEGIDQAVTSGVEDAFERLSGAAPHTYSMNPLVFSGSGTEKASSKGDAVYGTQGQPNIKLASDYGFKSLSQLYNSSSNPYQELTNSIYKQIEDQRIQLEEYITARQTERKERQRLAKEQQTDIRTEQAAAEKELFSDIYVSQSHEEMQKLMNMILDYEKEFKMT